MKAKILIADYMYNLVPKVPIVVWKNLAKKYEIIRHSYRKPLIKSEILHYAKDCVGIAAGIE